MRAPCETAVEYRERLEKERAIHDATRLNMERREINAVAETEMPYLRPQGEN